MAQRFLNRNLSRIKEDEALEAEYTRMDLYWRVIYYKYEQFKSHYDACINRILHAKRHGNKPENHLPTFECPQNTPDREPLEKVKESVKSRDHYRCLCCGYDKQKTQLQIDHISPSNYGGNNHPDNLQCLCKTCNPEKRINTISFRNNQTTLTSAPSGLPIVKTPIGTHAKDPRNWEMFLRRTINIFYRCAAVDVVEIGMRGEKFYKWRIRLFPGNKKEWLKPHLPTLRRIIRIARENAGFVPAPDRITVD